MNQTQHINAIAAKCRALIELALAVVPMSASHKRDLRQAIAAWNSTIAAIDALPDMDADSADILAKNICRAWPTELL